MFPSDGRFGFGVDMALGKRLEYARKLRGMTQQQLAQAAKMDPDSGRQAIQILESRDSQRTKYAGALAAALRIRLEWLTDGIDPMEATGAGPSYQLEDMAAWDDSTPMDADDVELPLFKEVEFAAGDGRAHQIEINGRKLRFSQATLRAAGVDSTNAACATNRGRSMERLILDGATIGIDRGRTQIKDGKIYAIDHGGELRVKYLYRLPGGGLRVRSENAEEYPDENYGPDWHQQMKVLGWVFWWSRLETW